MSPVGIIAAGAYVPRRRLQRRAVSAAVCWFNGGLPALADGERAVASWDEDAITMAVEAARDCLGEDPGADLAQVFLASTTHPFADRQNAGVVKEALNLSDHVGAVDIAGGQRAGTAALLQALKAAKGGAGPTLCLAAENRKTAPASELELTCADAAAAFVVGTGPGLAAEFLGGRSLSTDFVDHFRAADASLDYGWETRWVREEGFNRIMPPAIAGALAEAGLSAGEVDSFVMAAPLKGVNQSVARACGVPAERVKDPLTGVLGDAGAAQPLVLLAHALETAAAGDIILVASFGQGCDALVFRATGEIGGAVRGLGVGGWLRRRTPEDNYLRHLFFNGHLPLERGPRAEFDQKTPLTAYYRHRKAVTGLVGGRCVETGTVQFPRTEVGVSPNARRSGTQEDYPLAHRRARIVSHTADNLAYTPDPPVCYGAVEFEGGGRLTVEFVDVDPGRLVVGAPMRMMFRIKAIDELRGFKRYFWKAVPDYLDASPSERPAEGAGS